MCHRHVNNRRTFGMLLNARQVAARDEVGKGEAARNPSLKEACVSVETAKRRHALKHGVPSSYWRLRHHHGYMMSRPV